MNGINQNLDKLECIKCGAKYEIDDYYYGCPKCFDLGERGSLTFKYKDFRFKDSKFPGMRKYANVLPYTEFPSLGEGDTPVVCIEKLAKDLGIKDVFIKNEFQNPTGSHKDRMSPLIIARAKELGKKIVVAASSGNAGLSLAIYAAYSGLECKIIVTDTIPEIFKESILATGADLIITKTADERWDYMKEKVSTEGWYPVTNFVSPPVSSNCFGIQGYKTVAYEIFDQFAANIPDFIFVPVARGDLMWGIYEGLKELKAAEFIKTIPKIVAVEPLARLSKVLKGDDYRTRYEGNYEKTASIGGDTVTYQSFLAVKETGGFAIEVWQDEIDDSIKEMAKYGFYLESSSATVIRSLKKAVSEGLVDSNSTVLLIATSHGFKNDPASLTNVIEA